MNDLIKCIQDALGTAETGDALVEVARNAHRAERELASQYNDDAPECDGTWDDARYNEG
jgi:hypothetical protein